MNSSDRRRALGTITTVTAERFVVELNGNSENFTMVGFDAQHYVARIGSFVLIPLSADYVVAEITGLRDTDLSGHKESESEIHDSQALTSTKYLDVVPIGMLPFRKNEKFRFGVSAFPPLYSDALYAQTSDLDRILDVEELRPIGSGSITDEDGLTATTSFPIGTSVVFDDYEVKVRIDEFFGGHSAILGNTGSGKSCTVATIIQSVFSKETEYRARGASFLFFDTNGEYRQAFEALPSPIAKRYAVISLRAETEFQSTDAGESVSKFRLPHWFMSIEEWELLLQASEKAQRPVLRSALGLTSILSDDDVETTKLWDHVLSSACIGILQKGESVAASAERIRSLLTSYPNGELNLTVIEPLLANDFGHFLARGNENGELIHAALDEKLIADFSVPNYSNQEFDFSNLRDAIELAILYEESHGNRNIRDYCSSLLTRFDSIAARSDFEFMRPEGPILTREKSIEDFVDYLLGFSEGDSVKESQITILDMNEIEDEIVEVVASVVTRLVFERLRRQVDRNSTPVNLVLEEAHRYISDEPAKSAIDAIRIFERVAKEGRKYGLFLLLASQRPNELSQTVLSQCSNFVVHRIQNPEDLSHIRRMTPFISEAVLRRLPSLPKQHALIFGNSVNVPSTFRVRDAEPKPRSDDAQISELWFVASS